MWSKIRKLLYTYSKKITADEHGGKGMCSAVDVANYLIFVTSDICSDMSNIKVNKLVYFAQGHALQQGFCLFEDEIRAGNHGPMIENLYHHYEKWGNQSIKEWDEESARSLPEDIKDFLIEVAAAYGQYSASELRYMTHKPNTPWKKHYKSEGRYRVIPKDDIRKYFANDVSSLRKINEINCEYVGYRDSEDYIVLPKDMR